MSALLFAAWLAASVLLPSPQVIDFAGPIECTDDLHREPRVECHPRDPMNRLRLLGEDSMPLWATYRSVCEQKWSDMHAGNCRGALGNCVGDPYREDERQIFLGQCAMFLLEAERPR